MSCYLFPLTIESTYSKYVAPACAQLCVSCEVEFLGIRITSMTLVSLIRGSCDFFEVARYTQRRKFSKEEWCSKCIPYKPKLVKINQKQLTKKCRII